MRERMSLVRYAAWEPVQHIVKVRQGSGQCLNSSLQFTQVWAYMHAQIYVYTYRKIPLEHFINSNVTKDTWIVLFGLDFNSQLPDPCDAEESLAEWTVPLTVSSRMDSPSHWVSGRVDRPSHSCHIRDFTATFRELSTLNFSRIKPPPSFSRCSSVNSVFNLISAAVWPHFNLSPQCWEVVIAALIYTCDSWK